MRKTISLHHETGALTGALFEAAAAAPSGYRVPPLALLERFIETSENAVGIDLAAITAGSIIWLKTTNSEYCLRLLDPLTRRVTVQGGSLFAEPTEAIVSGSGGGGSVLRVGWIGTGLQLEMSCSFACESAINVVTSPIQRFALQRHTD
jgi:hypothetical protein